MSDDRLAITVEQEGRPRDNIHTQSNPHSPGSGRSSLHYQLHIGTSKISLAPPTRICYASSSPVPPPISSAGQVSTGLARLQMKHGHQTRGIRVAVAPASRHASHWEILVVRTSRRFDAGVTASTCAAVVQDWIRDD